MGVEHNFIKPVVNLDDIAFFNKIKIEEYLEDRINIFNSDCGFESIEDLGVTVQDIKKLEYTLSTNKPIPTDINKINEIMLRSKLISITGKNKDGKTRNFDKKFQQNIEINLKYSKASGLNQIKLKKIMELLCHEI
ncbi:hypothetical protein [Mycoplasma sp. P36-A1]|uniref:hypothetical protein n=1 Tax=Mycoplasma sp. P36-A1 TaxID=3252900 RepID=UPI003C2E22F2